MSSLLLAVAIIFAISGAPSAHQKGPQTGQGTEQTGFASKAEIDAFVAKHMARLGVAGVSVALIQNGQLETFAYGVARKAESDGENISAALPARADTPFHVASISKSFASLIILQLAEEGRVDTSDPVIKQLPNFRLANQDHSNRLTIRHLMDHSTGLSTLDGNRLHAHQNPATVSAAEAVAMLASAQPLAAPGQAFIYSNANYQILAHLIETLEQKSFTNVVEDRVFTPLGMQNSAAHRSQKHANLSTALGYVDWFGVTRLERDYQTSPAMLAAGGLSISAADLGLYLNAIMQGDKAVVPAALSAFINRAEDDVYDLGWFSRRIGGRRAVYHGGLMPGFTSQMMILPDEGIAALALVNQSGILGGNLAESIVNMALKLPGTEPAPSTGMVGLAISTILGLLGLILGAIAASSKAHKLRREPWTLPRPLLWLAIVLPPIGLMTLAYAAQVWIPQASAITIQGAWLFTPDFALIMTGITITASLWALVMPAFLIQRARVAVDKN